MGRRNITHVSDFILMGLTDSEEIQLVLFTLFLLIYLITVLGNVGMILIIRLDLRLHTPIYFSSVICHFLTSVSQLPSPLTLDNILTSNKYISYLNCFIQMNCFVFVGVTECVLPASIAYDHYAAICNPLHYPVVMSTRRCCSLVFGSFLIGFMDTFVNVLCLSRLHCCDSNVIYHFFCNAPPVLALSCADTHDIEITISIFAGSTLVVSLITLAVSYVSVFSTILKITSPSGRQKAFSTCVSHLLSVTIFYGTMIITYIKPSKSYSLGKDQVASVFYSIVTPMLNPLIYSLRNKEVKHAVRRVLQKRKSSKKLKQHRP